MMRFYLDGTLVDPATNWQEVSSTIRRDKELNVFLLFQEYTLTFDGSGFQYLVNLVNNDSFCREVDILIEKRCDETWQTIFAGVFFVSDCEVNEKTGTIKVKVNDKSFFSKINNNKNIKTSMDGGKTKNNLDITDTEVYNVGMYSVGANTLVRTVECCRVEEAFRYLIDFMTDNSVSFVSDTFGAGGDWEGLALTTGERMRGSAVSLAEGRWEPFSFLTLFTEVNNRVPIILLVENPFTSPVIRIESIDYLYGQGINMIADNVDEVVTSFDTDKLYALVKFGSPTDDTNILDFPEQIDYYGYKEEEFHLLGKCNLDRTLDLSSDWIVSSNLIQRMIDSNHQDFDNDIVLIDTVYTSDTVGRSTNDNFLNTSPPFYHYNKRLNNQRISERYIEDLSNQIAAWYINNTEGQALGYQSAALSITGAANYETRVEYVLPLDAEAYDNGGYYDPALYRFVALQAANFTIKAQVTTDYIGAGPNLNQGLFYFTLEHLDASNNLINSWRLYNPNSLFYSGAITDITATTYNISLYELSSSSALSQNKIHSLNGTGNAVNVNMAQDDYLQLRGIYLPYAPPGQPISGINVDVMPNVSTTYIQCIATSLTGSTFLNIDPDDIKVQKHKFTYPIQQGTFDTILNNPIGRIGFGMASQAFRYGWIEELKYNHSTNIAEFTLTTNRKSQNAY